MSELKGKYIVIYDNGQQMTYDKIILPDRATLNDITHADIHLAMIKGERMVGYYRNYIGTNQNSGGIKNVSIKSLLNTSKIRRIDVIVES